MQEPEWCEISKNSLGKDALLEVLQSNAVTKFEFLQRATHLSCVAISPYLAWRCVTAVVYAVLWIDQINANGYCGSYWQVLFYSHSLTCSMLGFLKVRIFGTCCINKPTSPFAPLHIIRAAFKFIHNNRNILFTRPLAEFFFVHLCRLYRSPRGGLCFV